MRTRDAGRPSDSAASIDTPAIGLFELATTELATEPAPTLRKSSSSVSGSGRVAVYATGSLASMTSDAPLAPTFELIAVSRTLSGGGALVAMVQGPDNKTYIVHQGDKLLDGTIKTITPQGLIVMQEVNDPLSLVKQREVRKLLRSLEDAK